MSSHYPNVIPFRQIRLRIPDGAGEENGTATITGDVISDAVRAADTANNDGRQSDSSYGIWPGATNLVSNGMFEEDTASWVAIGSAVIAQDFNQHKFNSHSLRVDTTDPTVDCAEFEYAPVSANTTYSYSLWVYSEEGGESVLPVWKEYDAVPTFLRTKNGTPVTLEAGWNRVRMPNQTTGSSTTQLGLRLHGSVATPNTLWIDGVQLEAGVICTPNIYTNTGTAVRADARVQFPSELLDADAGWIAARVRMGFHSADAASVLLTWDDLQIGFRDGTWFCPNLDGALAADTFDVDDEVTVIGAWFDDQYYISVNGSEFELTSTETASPISSLFDIGSNGVDQFLGGDILWVAFGAGVIMDSDIEFINSYGNVDHQPASYLWPDGVTAVWSANTDSYSIPTDGYIFSSLVERWPVTWETPNYAQTELTCVDAFDMFTNETLITTASLTTSLSGSSVPAAAILQSADLPAVKTATSVSVSTPSTVRSGNALFVAVYWNSTRALDPVGVPIPIGDPYDPVTFHTENVSVYDSAGNQYILVGHAVNPHFGSCALYYAYNVVGGSVVTATATFPGKRTAMIGIVEASGLRSDVVPLDKKTTSVGTFDSSTDGITTTPVTTTADAELLIGAMIEANSAGTVKHVVDAGTGWTKILGKEVEVQYQVQSVQGSAQGLWTENHFTPGYYAAILGTFLVQTVAVSDSDLVWTAKASGAGGNAISIHYANPGSPSQALSISFVGAAITINLATNSSSVVTTTGNQIIKAIQADPVANALVSVARVPGSTGDGIVGTLTATSLSGGTWPAELSGARINRVLDKVGWTGERAIDTGNTTIPAMGFAQADNVSALQHLQDVADGELGVFFIDSYGTATFHDRYHRLTFPNNRSQAIFGDDDTEVLEYVDLQPSMDLDHVINRAELTRLNGSNVQAYEDADSIRKYHKRVLTKDILTTTDADALYQAQYIVGEHSNPRLRFDTISFDPFASPQMFEQAVQRQIGDRITIIRRPPNGSVLEQDFYIEAKNWSVEDPYIWRISWQLSPAPEIGYLVLDDPVLGQLDVNALSY